MLIDQSSKTLQETCRGLFEKNATDRKTVPRLIAFAMFLLVLLLNLEKTPS
jgi:predicted nucleic acid-binding Zn ribbon protein